MTGHGYYDISPWLGPLSVVTYTATLELSALQTPHIKAGKPENANKTVSVSLYNDRNRLRAYTTLLILSYIPDFGLAEDRVCRPGPL